MIMEYSECSIGRVFLVKFEHKDDLIENIRALALKERISFATITFLGALSKGDIVCGPKKTELPALPARFSFKKGHEVVGFGTIAKSAGEVQPHIHAAIGKGKKAMTGCLRKGCEVFVTVEAVITELKGVDISRKMDKNIGHTLLAFK